MGKLNATQKFKRDFRKSKVWTAFRHLINVKQKGIDPITQKKLCKGSNLHHKDLNEAHYTDLSNEEHFVMLNKKTHEAIHWLYTYYRKDKDIIGRITNLLEEMYEINET